MVDLRSTTTKVVWSENNKFYKTEAVGLTHSHRKIGVKHKEGENFIYNIKIAYYFVM